MEGGIPHNPPISLMMDVNDKGQSRMGLEDALDPLKLRLIGRSSRN
jgi:hypothetical protein